MERFVRISLGHVIDLRNGREYPLVTLRGGIAEEVKLKAEIDTEQDAYFYSIEFVGVTLKFFVWGKSLLTANNNDSVQLVLDYTHTPLSGRGGEFVVPRVLAAVSNWSHIDTLVECSSI